MSTAADPGPAGGRPPSTSRAELAVVAIALFAAQGFDETSVDEIAAAAGIGRRTFFRYFPTKSAVLWKDLDEEAAHLGALLAASDPGTPMMTAIREVVVAVNRARSTAALHELRARTELIATSAVLQQAAATHYEDWSRAIADFAAGRLGVAQGSLFPATIGRCVLGAAFAAYDVWAERGERSLAAYLDEAIGALADGFDEAAVSRRVTANPFTRRR